MMEPGPKAIKLFTCSTEHEILSVKIIKLLKNKDFSCFKILRWCIYLWLINVKMQTIAGILKFMSRINFLHSDCWDELEKSFKTSRPAQSSQERLYFFIMSYGSSRFL